MKNVTVISHYSKRPMKWTEMKTSNGKTEWSRVPVVLRPGQKMAMCIVTDEKGRKYTKHMIVDQ